MDRWITVAYIGIAFFSLVVFFCGDWPIFEGTCIQSINHHCTDGGFELIGKIVALICGDRGKQAVASVEHYFCERPNPILLLFYFTILAGTFIAVVNTSFGFVSPIHRYIGTCGVIIGAALFLKTSFTDPGTITTLNVSKYLSMYPYDGILYEEKICSTCNIVRPARSKHCSICGRCVARFDHHCGWTNTCIGQNNLRYFLLFLFWHCCLAMYGACVIVAILAGEVKQHNIVRVLTLFYGIEHSFQRLYPHILQWLVAFYMSQILITVFLVAICLLLLGFMGYHIYLVLTNTTTNERFKWADYKRWKNSLSQDVLLDCTPQASEKEASSQNPAKGRPVFTFTWAWLLNRCGSSSSASIKMNNIYDKGSLQNLREVFIPGLHSLSDNKKQQ